MKESEKKVGSINSFAMEHAEKWIRAWNNHDLEAVLSMYSDNIEFSSPKVKAVYPERKSSKITGKKELEQYWAAAIKNNFPNLHFTPIGTIIRGQLCMLEYYATLDGLNRTSVIEKFEFQGRLVAKSSVYYGSEEPI